MQEDVSGTGVGEMVSEDDFVSQLRLKASAEANASRIQKRTSFLNARRLDYEKIAKRTTVPHLGEFKKLCQYFSRDKKLKDVQRIRKGLASGQPYIDAFMETQGALYALIGCLTGINTRLQVESLQCVINLGLGTEAQCLRICKKAGSYLVTCLSSANTYLQELCCWAFGNLSGDHPSVCALLLSQGFESIVTSALSSYSQSVVRWSCYALNLYLHTVPDRIGTVCQPELLKRLLTTLLSDKENLSECTWCLFVVSTVPDMCQHLVNFGAVAASHTVLLRGIRDDSLDLKTATALVRLLSNCVAILHEVAIEICYRADEFITIVKYLLHSPYIHLQKETLQLVANLVEAAKTHSITGANVLEDSNLRASLEPVLRKVLASEFETSQAPNFHFASQCS